MSEGRALFRYTRAVAPVALYLAAALLPVIVASAYGYPYRNLAYEAGKNFAVLVFMVLALQVFLTARIAGIERPYGLDILIRFHRNMGIFALFLILSHPFLLVAGSGNWDILLGSRVSPYIWLGRVTLFILAVSIVLSVYQRQLNLTFEQWRLVHDVLSPLIITFAFLHSLMVGTDLNLAAMQLIWTASLALVFLLFIYHRILRPRLLKRRAYRVIDVIPETKGVWTVKMAPQGGGRVFDYLPGQFQFITFFRDRGLPEEEHHWTISSSPAQKEYVSSTIKALGDFTSTVGETRAGDTAAIHGPFGRFSYILHSQERDLVFIAGGIGITPLMSMLRHMRDVRDTRSVLLLYANRDEDQIVFRKELAEIEEGGHPMLRMVHVLSDPSPGWTGESGFVDREKIARLCGDDLGTKVFYACGPPGLVDTVIDILKSLQVPDSRIRLEIFSFLD